MHEYYTKYSRIPRILNFLLAFSKTAITVILYLSECVTLVQKISKMTKICPCSGCKNLICRLKAPSLVGTVQVGPYLLTLTNRPARPDARMLSRRILCMCARRMLPDLSEQKQQSSNRLAGTR